MSENSVALLPARAQRLGRLLERESALRRELEAVIMGRQAAIEAITGDPMSDVTLRYTPDGLGVVTWTTQDAPPPET